MRLLCFDKLFKKKLMVMLWSIKKFQFNLHLSQLVNNKISREKLNNKFSFLKNILIFSGQVSS